MKIIATHNGSYHIDDVFAVATLALLEQGNIRIIRTRTQDELQSADYVVDVGGVYDPAVKRFDHHQKGGAGERDNGIPYASFGLVWKEYGEILCGSKEVAQSIDEYIVQGIDAPDNGVSLYTQNGTVSPVLLSSYLYSFQPSYTENQNDMDTAFKKAVDIAKEYIQRIIKKNRDYTVAYTEVIKIYKETEDKRILVLDVNYPWEGMLYEYSEPLFVVYPRTNGGWAVKGVPVKEGSFERRKDFPSSWAGLRDQELQNITGITDALFCHNNLFMVSAQNKEGAIMLAKLALNA